MALAPGIGGRPAPAGWRVLVVDDAPGVRALMRVLLDETDDLRVVAEAADGRQALRLAADVRPDLVLLDVGLPDLDGLAVARELRRRGCTARIVVFSGYGRPEVGREALACGADDWIEKDAGVLGIADRLRAGLLHAAGA